MLIIAKNIFMCYNCFALGGLNMEFDFNLPVKRIKDNKNPFSMCYQGEGILYYIEPIFKVKLDNFEALHYQQPYTNQILEKMKEIVLANKLVVFVGDHDDENDNVITNNVEDAIYLDFRDILDLCRIRVNDISRGSDYGD